MRTCWPEAYSDLAKMQLNIRERSMRFKHRGLPWRWFIWEVTNSNVNGGVVDDQLSTSVFPFCKRNQILAGHLIRYKHVSDALVVADMLETHWTIFPFFLDTQPINISQSPMQLREARWLSSSHWNRGGDGITRIQAHKKFPSWILSLFPLARKRRNPQTHLHELRMYITSEPEILLQRSYPMEALESFIHK